MIDDVHDPAEPAVVAHMEAVAAPVESVWHELVPLDGRHVHVHLTEPLGEAGELRVLFTTGMSDRPMPVPEGVEDADEWRYAELLVAVPADFFGEIRDGRVVDDAPGEWLIGVLQWLARLPQQAQAVLVAGLSIPNGDPPTPFEDGVPFAGVMLVPPAFDTEGEDRIEVGDGRIVHLLGVLFLHADELAFKRSRELDDTLERLDEHEISEYLDLDRRSFVRPEDLWGTVPSTELPPQPDGPEVAFVLVEEPTVDAAAVEAAAAATGLILTPQDPVAGDEEDDSELLAWSLPAGGSLLVMPVALPDPDAAHTPIGPLAAPRDELERHQAHLIVTLFGVEGDALTRDRLLTRATAAVIRGSSAVAAMRGGGTMFYRADLFAELAEQAAADGVLPVEVCVDITVAPEPDDRMSFLTHGLPRYGREDFYVTCPVAGTGALEFLLGLVQWMIVEPDKVLPTGDTLGRTAEERVQVQREPHPGDADTTVIRLDL